MGLERETQDSFKMKQTDEREREREALNMDFPFLLFFSLSSFPSPFIVIEKSIVVVRMYSYSLYVTYNHPQRIQSISRERN